MAVSAAVKTWSTNEKLTSSDLNAEFTNVYNNTAVAGGIVAEQLDLTDGYAWTGLHTFNNANTLFGYTSALTTGITSQVQILGTASPDSSLLVGRFSADAFGGSINFLKSRHATLGSNTIVVDNDVLGGLYWYGADGSDFATPGASVVARVNGTPGANDLPTELVFSTTADGGNSTTERMRISQAGVVEVVGALDVGGDADIDGTTNLDAVDIDGAVQIDATVSVGVDDQGYDVKFFGDTASAYLLWDTSADKLLTAGGAVIDIVKDKLLIGGTAVTTTAAELNILDDATVTTAELNLIDGGTARGTDAVASGDGILINDGGTMKMTNVDTVSTYFAAHNVGGSNIATVGTITSGTFSGVLDGTVTMTVGSDALGDMYYRDGSGHLERLPASTDGYVLTATGAGSIPAWEAASAGAVTALNNATQSELVTVGSTTTELDAESNLTFDGSTLAVTGAATVSTSLTVGGGYGSTGATISTAGVGQFNGALTTDGTLAAGATTIGGDSSVSDGYGFTVGGAASDRQTVNGVLAETQILGTGDGDSAFTIGRWGNNASSALFYMVKSRGGSIGAASSAVANDDRIGQIIWCVDDSNDYAHPAGRLWCEVDDGSIAQDEIGGAVVISTTGVTGSETERLRIGADGNFVGSSSADISDSRLKENVATLSGSLAKIKQLRGVEFTWKASANKDTDKHYGFLAQEVESIIPTVVWNKSINDVTAQAATAYTDGDTIPDGKSIGDVKTAAIEGKTFKSLHYSGLIPVLVEAIKELTARVEVLEA